MRCRALQTCVVVGCRPSLPSIAGSSPEASPTEIMCVTSGGNWPLVRMVPAIEEPRVIASFGVVDRAADHRVRRDRLRDLERGHDADAARRERRERAREARDRDVADQAPKIGSAQREARPRRSRPRRVRHGFHAHRNRGRERDQRREPVRESPRPRPRPPRGSAAAAPASCRCSIARDVRDDLHEQRRPRRRR